MTYDRLKPFAAWQLLLLLLAVLSCTVFAIFQIKTINTPAIILLVLFLTFLGTFLWRERKAEKLLEKSNSILKATIESTADGLLVVDLQGNIVQYNRKFMELWNIPESVINTGEDKKLREHVRNQLKYPEAFESDVQDLYSLKSGATTNDILEFSDGRFFERFSQPHIINGVCVGRVWSFRDISEMKRAEKELIAAKEKAEEGDRLKTAFLHNVSHEIRTPMNAIIGFSTLLNERGITDEERHEYAGVISESSNQLLSIISDIVDTANIESGLVKVETEPTDINELLKKVSGQFINKTNGITIRVCPGLSDDQSIVVTDSGKVRQILSKLAGNAFKFTREGHVEIGYFMKGGMLEFYVHDTGIGIREEYLPLIFSRFYQVEMSGTRQFGGTGLGLAICKAYVDLLGGKIWVESEHGKGTVFRFTIPYIRS